MKSFVIALTLCLSLAFVQAAPSSLQSEDKEENTLHECNATNPVKNNPRISVISGVISGNQSRLSQEEKCFLFCYLQKVHLLDENANTVGPAVVNQTLAKKPEFAKYVDVIIADLFQIGKSIKGIDDKCQKAEIFYDKFVYSIYSFEVASSIQSLTGIKDRVVDSIKSGKPLGDELHQQVKQTLGFLTELTSVYPAAAVNSLSKIV